MSHLNLRITEALALSALVHAGIYVWIFAPLAPMNGARQSEFLPGSLTVTIDRGPEQGGPQSARAPLLAAAPSAREAAPPASADAGAPGAARSKTRKLAREPGDRTRPALPDEVSVNVLLFTDKDPGNPQDALEIGGQRYIYFNSPGLRQQARPLSELRLRYPVARPENPDGSVVLELLINERGLLEGVSVLCAAPGFETSARESVAGLRFSPARGRDGPVKSFMLVEFGYGRRVPCDRIPD